MKAFVTAPSRLRRAIRALWLTAGAAFALACSGPADNQIFTLTLPDETTFPLVSDALELRCATIDCHGNLPRNMRLYSEYGLRLKKGDVTGIANTTDDEYAANYESIVTIEPEKITGIVKNHGQNFDHWIVVTKGTGAEHHKGGSKFAKGDVMYTCLLSWIQGNINMDACLMAKAIMAPDIMQPMSAGNPP
jgi:hypothetical protein